MVHSTTKIVTSFIQDNEKFLILKRSDKVRTMKGLWSGVSGIIEGKEEPSSRAKIEIFEELNITQDKIQLVKTAKQIRITAPQYKNHQWEVFPFLFSVKNNNDLKITLNWENSQYKWVTQKEIAQYQTVPNLDKILLCLL